MDDGSDAVSGSFAGTQRLFGRSALLQTINDYFQRDETRLLTLTGPGGVGKTRLAQAIAENNAGAIFVPLASLRESSNVLAAIGAIAAIENPHSGSMLAAIAHHVGDRSIIVVLDNLEQIAGIGTVVTDLLSEIPSLKMLATSRRALRVSAEIEIPVFPLPTHELSSVAKIEDLLESPAPQLFLQRASTVNPGFRPGDDDASSIAAICERLDGLPLALELAAARCRFLSVDELLSRLNSSFNLISGGPASAPPRHRSLRDTIAWSYDLLSEEERELFRTVSVFTGGFTFEAARLISRIQSEALLFELLGDLCDHGLLYRSERTDGEPRFAMLETIGEFGLDQLSQSGDADFARSAHATYYLELAESAGPNLKSESDVQARWWNRLEADIANFRAAIDWYSELTQFEDALRIVAGLDWFWTEHTYVEEGRRLLKRLLGHSDHINSIQLLATAHQVAGMLADIPGDIESSRWHSEESVRLSRMCGRLDLATRSLFVLANCAFDLEEFERARTLGFECLETAELVNDRWITAAAHVELGMTLEIGFGLYQEAISHYETSVQIFREIGEQSRINGALIGIATASLGLGDLDRCWESCTAAMELELSPHSERYYVHSLFRIFGYLAEQQGNSESAVTLFSASMKRERETGIGTRKPVRSNLVSRANAIRLRIGESAYSAAWTKGERLSMTEAIALAGSIPRPVSHAIPEEFSSLSRRELDVLRLIAAGKSDREIADELFIARRTASQHVSSVLRKLNLPSRTAAGTLAAKSRLL